MAELPLLIFTVLTGLSAGGYVMATIFGLVKRQRTQTFLFDVLCLILLGAGLLGALFHLGHPERFLNALANPSAMIAQEAYWSIPFGSLVLVDAILVKVRDRQGKAIPIIASILGCGLMTVTAIAYFTSYGVPGWPELPTLFQFTVGDLSLGAAFASVFLKVDKERSLTKTCTALYAALTLVLIWEAVTFGQTTVGSAPFIVAAILMAIATGIEGMPLYKRACKPRFAQMTFGLVLVAMIIARYGFYAAF